MKQTYIILILCLFSIISYSKPVIICGKVENTSIITKNFVELSINRIGLSQINKKCKIDKSGEFYFKFNLENPTDIWVDYRTNFLVALHPGDSLHIIFDGSKKKRPAMLNTIKYSGDAARLNMQISKTQRLYYDSGLYIFYNIKNYEKRVKRSTATEYFDFIKMEKEKIINKINNSLSNPSEEAKRWSQIFIEESVGRLLNQYPSVHFSLNKLDKSFKFTYPENYFDYQTAILPIIEKDRLSCYSLNDYVNYYIHNLKEELSNDTSFQKKMKELYLRKESEEKQGTIIDSFYIERVLADSQCKFFKELCLAEFLKKDFRYYDGKGYEATRVQIDSYLENKDIIKWKNREYKKTKQALENPTFASATIFKKASENSLNEIISEIKNTHKGKVIYIDCWATWCGPCIANLPHSQSLHNELKNEPVSFIYLCIESDKKLWKKYIAKYKLDGDHYFLSKEQSVDLRSTFDISGIPHYIMINKEGRVLSDKYNIAPNSAKNTIIKLLE